MRFMSVYSKGQDAVKGVLKEGLSGLGFWDWVFSREEKQGKKEFCSWDYITAQSWFLLNIIIIRD